MKLADVLRRESVAADAQFRDKSGALHGIVEIAKRCPILSSVDDQELLASLERREKLGSTGFGKGIAIPHCRLESVSEFVVGLVSVPGGVDFDAIDGQPVKVIVFIIAPEAEPNKHIEVLSAISQTLLMPGAVDEILAQGTAEALYESFLRHTAVDIGPKDSASKNLLHVFVQDEGAFRDILQMLAGIESSSIVVLDAENVGAYLAEMPMFADFWTDSPSRFSRVIVAVVERGLTNETIRRIESITGDLNTREGVLVTVQQISYSSGTLSARP
ncbi:MAG: PTS sugar transporter subunit IIA [Phycisphaerales bacterium]|nr:MAG: PTS sugar transporter subunit IIA [Phycisphaerales bacterium]